MRPSNGEHLTLTSPALLDYSKTIAGYLRSLNDLETKNLMKVSTALAKKVVSMHQQLHLDGKTHGTAAILTFQGDVYSHLAAEQWSEKHLDYASNHLRIISGLYGSLRPLDAIEPYRLELSYRLAISGTKNLYEFWSSKIAEALPAKKPVVNLLSEEYFRAIKPYVQGQIISPQFLTQTTAGEVPRSVAIHAKQARGSFARWLIVRRITNPDHFSSYAELGYQYSPEQSVPGRPVFIKQQN